MYVHIDASEVHDLADDMRRNAGEARAQAALAADRTGHEMKATAIVLSPDLTGIMDATMSLEVHGTGFDLGPTVKHGLYVELGTSGPYPIENAFGWGVTIMHPGNAPEPFLGPAFDAGLPGFEKAIGDIGDGAVSSHG